MLALVAACNEGEHARIDAAFEPKVSGMATEVLIRPGEPGPELVKRYPGQVQVEHQPAGIDFYKIDWPQKAPGMVRVENGKHSFWIRNVLGLQAAQDLGEFQAEGLSDVTVLAGITQPDLIAHDEARMKMQAILVGILEAGWKSTVDIGDPRVLGKARLDYALSQNKYVGLDPAHVPLLADWMRIESRTPWNFYADGLYLQLSFTREPKLIDPAKPGSYLLRFNIKTEVEYLRGYVGPDDRVRWKTLLPDVLAKAAASRVAKEADLRAKGVFIDDAYRDPPVPALK